ncbi:FecR family protein [Paraburkholderia fungorum]|uniref:FecR domain-containing protein n=1 Tax=Paraburkholderia fungorum TaxID=134537 RepID=UPI0038B91AEC
MSRLTIPMRTLPALIAGLLLAAPVAAANVEGVTLTFLPGRGLKPLVQTERRVPEGGQQVTTGALQILEVLFPDGTSLTLSPNSDVTVDAFSYGDAGGSRLALSVNRGLVRIEGGAVSEVAPITVKTASGEVRLDAASAVIEVDGSGRTRVSMLAGHAVQLTSNGQTQTVERPGFELMSSGQASLSGPSREPEGGAATDAFGLGTAQLAGLTQRAEDDLGRAGITELAAIGASTLALATENQPAGTLPSGGGGGGGFSEIGGVGGGSGSAGFGTGSLIAAPTIQGDEPSATRGLGRSLLQSRDPNLLEKRDNNAPALLQGSDAYRDPGPSTNRLFTSGFTETISGTQAPIAVPAIDKDLNNASSTRLQYVFLEKDTFPYGTNPRYTFGIALEVPDLNTHQSWVGDGPTAGSIEGAPFILPRVLPASGAMIEIVATPLGSAESEAGQGSIFDAVKSSAVSATTTYKILQAGFSQVNVSALTNEPYKQTVSTVLSEVPLRAPDNFLLLQAEPTGGDGSEQFLFAAGNVDSGRIFMDPTQPATYGTVNNNVNNTFSVDRFFISAGLNNFDQKDTGATVASGIRAFMRSNTSLSLPLNDSGLFVVNTAGVGPVAYNSFIHADFGMQGAGSAQQSTISLTVGNGTYSPVKSSTAEVATISVNERGLTIGSSHGLINGSQVGTVAINSPLINTSAGGGNPALQRAGYAGYFVFENYTPSTDWDFTAALNGGTEHAIGSAVSSDVDYAALRLATATGAAAVGTRGSNLLTGWAGGLAEKENGPGAPLTIVPIGTGTDPNNFIIQTDAIANHVQAAILLSGHAPMTLGGASNPSAMIDDSHFGAANASVAMVNANLLRDANGNLPAALNLPNGQPIPNYQYLQWGFLFGDTAGTAGTDLEHLHLGTWIAGRPADPSQLPTTGSASYTGHAIGNVASGGALYTAVGSYDNTWNFARRAGTVNLNFDGAQYNGTTQLGTGVAFTGSLNATNAARTGGVVGGFVQAPGGSPAATPPPAVAGRFVLQETAGSPYRASGTFGAERNK